MKENINKLIGELKSKDGIKRQMARAELVEIGEQAINPLKQLLSSKKHHTRWEAIKAIGEIGSTDSIPVLIDFLKDEKFDIRWLAAEGLITVGRESIGPLVSALLEDSSSIFLREATHHVLKDLKAKNQFEDVSGIIPALENYNQFEILKAGENLINEG